ncbi:MAG: FtsX-like permease family protein, partial [Planctomycetota bacterium]|nr:FtsX-like permease family protein [Planctomycetota bacterium]
MGDSVRGSLRDLVLQRLGRTDQVVVSAGFVREQLAEELRAHPNFRALFDGICPLVVIQGFVTVQSGAGRAGQVRVYGVDHRFWQFHGIDAISGPDGREALISPALASELGAQAGTTILVRVERPSEVPLESLHGRKEDLGRTLRATVRAVIPREALGEFSLQAQQGAIRAVFLPLALLQQDLEIGSRVNALLISAKPESAAASTTALEQLVRSEAKLEDLGLELRVLEARHAFALEADGGLLDHAVANAAMDAASEIGLQPQPVFTYLANSLRSGGREIPYSLVTAMNLPAISGLSPIVLNDWAARDLQVAVGDAVTMEYSVWEEPGRLFTRTTEFRIAGVVPIDTRDRDLAPAYPGITESPSLKDWDPPFPIDLRRIRSVDEEYWKLHHTTPKAFIPFAVGEQLWQSRYGSMTSIRFTPDPGQPLEEVRREYAERLRAKIDPLAMGIAVRDVRAEGLEASRGATDFGEYFVYFSFFLVASSLLLAALFFKLSVEQRAREVGLLRAVGFGTPSVRWLFMREGLLLSIAGAAAGVLGGIGYAYLMMTGLSTWWVEAVGTTALTLHVSPASLAGGALGGIAASMACIWATLRSLSTVSERRLLAGQLAA